MQSSYSFTLILEIIFTSTYISKTGWCLHTLGSFPFFVMMVMNVCFIVGGRTLFSNVSLYTSNKQASIRSWWGFFFFCFFNKLNLVWPPLPWSVVFALFTLHLLSRQCAQILQYMLNQIHMDEAQITTSVFFFFLPKITYCPLIFLKSLSIAGILSRSCWQFLPKAVKLIPE